MGALSTLAQADPMHEYAKTETSRVNGESSAAKIALRYYCPGHQTSGETSSRTVPPTSPRTPEAIKHRLLG
jgi:hypothetical protein